jgi:hypothetical protein
MSQVPTATGLKRAASPAAWAGPVVGAAFLAGVGGGVARSTNPYPRPGSSARQIQDYFSQPSRAPWVSISGQYLSAAALAAWTSQVANLTADDDSIRLAALVGGGVAAAALATAASCAAVLAAGGAGTPDHRVQLHRAAFTAGGPVHGAGFGLLLAALGVAGRRSGRLSQAVTTAALVAALPNLLAPLYQKWPGLVWLIPAGRFPGLIVTAIAGIRLATAGGPR